MPPLDGCHFRVYVRAFASARLGLLKVLRIEQKISYSKCREFQADSPIISQVKAR